MKTRRPKFIITILDAEELILWKRSSKPCVTYCLNAFFLCPRKGNKAFFLQLITGGNLLHHLKANPAGDTGYKHVSLGHSAGISE